MTAIANTGVNTTRVIIVGDSGDGATVAALFNGIIHEAVSHTAAVAANSSGTVTVTWAESGVKMGIESVLDYVRSKVAAVTTLTSPITISADGARRVVVIT